MVVINSTQKTVPNLRPGTRYTFYIRAYNSDGGSPRSTLVNFTTRLGLKKTDRWHSRSLNYRGTYKHFLLF